MGRRQERKRHVAHDAKGCRKRRFRDHAEAIREMHHRQATSTRTTIPHRVYECPRCGGFHLSSSER